MHNEEEDENENEFDADFSDPVVAQKIKEARTARLIKQLNKLGLEDDEIKVLLPTDDKKEAFLKDARTLSKSQDEVLVDDEEDASDDEEDEGEISETDARDVKLLKAAKAAKAAKADRDDKIKNKRKKDAEGDLALDNLNSILPEDEKVSVEEWLATLDSLKDLGDEDED